MSATVAEIGEPTYAEEREVEWQEPRAPRLDSRLDADVRRTERSNVPLGCFLIERLW